MNVNAHRHLSWFCLLPLLALTLCAPPLRADSPSDGQKRKPNVKLWKSEKEQGEADFKDRQTTDAEIHFKAALAEAENFDAKDYRLAESLTELGDLYTRVGNFAEAEPLLQRAATARKGDPNSLTEAYVQFLLGFTCLQLRHYNDAEKALLRAQELYSRKTGHDSPPAVLCMFYLGALYDDQHDYAKAESLLKRSASLFEHPATRTINHKINDPAARGGMDVWVGQFRPNYVYAMEALARLGSLYAGQDRAAEAASSFKNAVKLLDERLAKNDPAAPPALGQVATLLLARTNYAGAEPFLQRLVVLDEKAQGPNQPETLNAKSALAAAYTYEGKFTEADATYKELVATLEKASGENKFPLIRTLNNYAALLHKMKRDSEAGSIEARAKALQAEADK